MGKKTKKEKIIADLRRKVQAVQSQASPAPANKTPLLSAIDEPKKDNFPLKPTFQTPSLYIYPVQLIRKDLTKTFLLSILAISLEVALFLLLEKHLVLPFRISF
ncbi:MAG TPA: hypothetical protein VMW04_02125 [Patescibacteria group bacterium]|nr:hypothetical protein [Patescibacteria group bacterium]